MNRNLGLCYTICWKFRASQINPFSYHYTLNKPLKNRKKVIINFRESRIENSHSNTKASLFYGNITIGIISGEWGSIIMLAGPTSPTYRGSTVNHLDEMSCLVPDSTSNYRGVEHFMKFFNFLKMVLIVKMVLSHSKTCEYYQNNKITGE